MFTRIPLSEAKTKSELLLQIAFDCLEVRTGTKQMQTQRERHYVNTQTLLVMYVLASLAPVGVLVAGD